MFSLAADLRHSHDTWMRDNLKNIPQTDRTGFWTKTWYLQCYTIRSTTPAHTHTHTHTKHTTEMRKQHAAQLIELSTIII